MNATFVPFTAQTRMSGVNLDGRQDSEGRRGCHRAYVTDSGAQFSGDPDDGGPYREGRATRGCAERRDPRGHSSSRTSSRAHQGAFAELRRMASRQS